MTFYLKYRPQTLEDLDLKSVRESLKKIISSGDISHAFLLSGPKGIGKTSAARILAKIVNCENPTKDKEPCNKCDQCISITKGTNIDVVEIDAASHRGIDDVRVLRDAVKLSPSYAKKKIYIIDEAHMLTTEASNALLKTLEEPPEHVMFILATTNPEKLIDTIRSRTTNIVFKKASNQEIFERLDKVLTNEKIVFEKEALESIAEASEGSFRDSLKILEQILAENISLKKDTISEYLFHKTTFKTSEFFDLLIKSETKKALDMVENAVRSGLSSNSLAKNILGDLRKQILAEYESSDKAKSLFSKKDLIYLTKLFSKAVRQIQGSLIEQLPIELAIIEWCEKKFKTTDSDKDADIEFSDRRLSADKKNSKRKTLKSESGRGSKTIGTKTETIHTDVDKKVVTNFDGAYEVIDNEGSQTNVKLDDSRSFSDEIWLRILAEIRPKNASTEALLRAAKPLGYDGKKLILGVYYSFHKERLEGSPHRDLLESVIQEITGESVRVVCTLTTPPSKKDNGGVILVEPEKINGGNFPQNNEVIKSNELRSGESEDIIDLAKEIFS